MTPEIQNWIRNKVALGVIPRGGSILEVGSMNVNGSVRDSFDQADYVGIDQAPGPGVDEVVNVHYIPGRALQAGPIPRLAQPNDLVLCLEVLEHDPDPVGLVRVLRSYCLKPGGLLVLSTPTSGFPEHRHPKDYWRFMRDAYQEIFFKGMQVLALDDVKCPAGFPGLIGVAKKGAV